MKLSKKLQEDIARLRESLKKALSQAPKEELNKMIWQLTVDNLPLKDAKEAILTINKFSERGIQFDIAPNFQIIAFIPIPRKKKSK